MKQITIWLGLCWLSAWLAACAPKAPPALVLASFTESRVQVTISLEYDEEGAALAALFAPTEANAHLYSKDLPRNGVEGLGRPTLLELALDSHLEPRGELQADAVAETIVVAPNLPALPVYPAGPVTLRLPVRLPDEAKETITEQLMITYMACTPKGCYKPVDGKSVEVTIPLGK